MEMNMGLSRLFAVAIGRTFGNFIVSLILMKKLPRARFVYRIPKFDVRGEIKIGNSFCTFGRLFPVSISVAKSGSLQIGDDVFINQGSRIHSEESISIGSRTEIGDLVCLYDTNFHAVEPMASVKMGPIIVGEDCWIGSGAIILPGVQLGRGCVVASGSVVSRSFPKGTLIAGNPASAIRSFDVPSDFRRRGGETAKD